VEATRVFADGQAMLKKIIEGRWLTASGVMALLPANSVGDDIEFYTDDTRTEVAMTWYGLRQQTEKHVIDGVMRPSRCLADFVAPKDSGIADYAGMFAVTAGWVSRRRKKPSSTRWTTTRPSCSKAWPTAWPRPLPNACTTACAPTCGAMRAGEH
jgi:5-methyltetrahydrofolate--homocysteine methyltransferase